MLKVQDKNWRPVDWNDQILPHETHLLAQFVDCQLSKWEVPSLNLWWLMNFVTDYIMLCGRSLKTIPCILFPHMFELLFYTTKDEIQLHKIWILLHYVAKSHQANYSPTFVYFFSAVAARPALILDIPSDREEFNHMIRLCKDPAILGNRLLEEVTQLAGSETAQNKQGKKKVVFINIPQNLPILGIWILLPKVTNALVSFCCHTWRGVIWPHLSWSRWVALATD